MIELLYLATALEVLDISDAWISKKKHQQRIVDALCNSKVAKKIKELRWSKDIKVDQVGEETIKKFLESMPELKHLELLGCIHSRTKREALRNRATTDFNVRLALTSEEYESESELEIEEGSEDKETSSDGSGF